VERKLDTGAFIVVIFIVVALEAIPERW